MDELKVFAPVAVAGMGMNRDTVDRAFRQRDIDAIAFDSGSIDPGPAYYHEGNYFKSKENIRSELRYILKKGHEADIPILTGTAGGTGTNSHTTAVIDWIRDICTEEGLEFTLAGIETEVDPGFLKQQLRAGRVKPEPWGTALTEAEIDESDVIVSLIGHRPFLNALEDGADVIIGGRSLDVSVFAALAIDAGFDPALAYHFGKLLECAGAIGTPGSGYDGVIGTMYDDYFELECPNPEQTCTFRSISIQLLHEKSNPNIIYTPTGDVDISNAKIEEIDNGKVRLSGSRFQPKQPPEILLEGIKEAGYRSISVAGIASPMVIANLDKLFAQADEMFAKLNNYSPDKYTLNKRVYGNGEVSIYDIDETEERDLPRELGIVIDVVGDSRQISEYVCKTYIDQLRHCGFDGKFNRGSNLAFPFQRLINVGEVYEFSVYHLLEGTHSDEIADITTEVIG